VKERYDYTPFGVSTVYNASWIVNAGGSNYVWKIAFQGMICDAVIGLFYQRMRWYSPTLGRWISVDPLLFEAGDINLYGSMSNNPCNEVDPSGLVALGDLEPEPIPKYDPTNSTNWLKWKGDRVGGYIPPGARFPTFGVDPPFNCDRTEACKQVRRWIFALGASILNRTIERVVKTGRLIDMLNKKDIGLEGLLSETALNDGHQHRIPKEIALVTQAIVIYKKECKSSYDKDKPYTDLLESEYVKKRALYDKNINEISKLRLQLNPPLIVPPQVPIVPPVVLPPPPTGPNPVVVIGSAAGLTIAGAALLRSAPHPVLKVAGGIMWGVGRLIR
jgi:RHS repeat-associated protein